MHTTLRIENAVADAMKRGERKVARAMTGAMRDTTIDLKEALRGQILDAGLGSRLANTWRGRTYPGKNSSIHPTGYAWSRAPEIISFFSQTQNVVAINGHKYLAIPTKQVPRGLRKRARLSVGAVMAQLGKKLIILPGKNGHLLGMVDRSGPRVGKRKIGVVRRNLVLLFTFVRDVTGRKRFDLPSLVREIATTFPARVDRRLA